MDEFDDLLKKFETPNESGEQSEIDKPDVLVIDDDESMRRGLKSALTHKYTITTAESGRQGIEAINKAFHCVILDVKMQDMNGFETYPKLKEKCPEVPIVFFTAFQSEHDLQEIINRFKPEGYVEKGRDISFLEHLIENAIKKYHLILENEEYKKDLEKKVEARTEQYKKEKEKSDSLLKEMHLLELDIMLGEQLMEIMHTDTSLLINPVSTHFNMTEDVIDAFSEYADSLLPDQTKNQFFGELNFEINRLKETQKMSRGVIDDYRNNFKALHELRASNNPIRDINSDLKYLQSLVNSQFAFVQAHCELEVDNKVPLLDLKNRVQSSFLEIAINAVKHGKASKILCKTEYVYKNDDCHDNLVRIHIYNNGNKIEYPNRIFMDGYSSGKSTGTGLYRTKARIERNGGTIEILDSDLLDFNVCFMIDLPDKKTYTN